MDNVFITIKGTDSYNTIKCTLRGVVEKLRSEVCGKL